MKRMIKQITAFAIVCTMICSALTVQTWAGTQKVYWLSGVSKMAGGNMRMYYKNKNTILLKGKLRKSSSIDSVGDAEEKKASYSLKVAEDCKVVFIEADNSQTINYAAWADSYKKGDEISYIGATIKVKNKKIVKIIFSA